MPGERDTQIHFHILKEAAHALSRALQEQEVIETLLSQVVSALAAHGALVRLLSPDGGELLPAGALGLSEVYMQKGPVRVAESLVDQPRCDLRKSRGVLRQHGQPRAGCPLSEVCEVAGRGARVARWRDCVCRQVRFVNHE